MHLRQGPPSHRVEAHVDVEHRGHGFARGRRVYGVSGGREDLEERADDEEEDAHAHAGDEERQLAPEGVDKEEDEECGPYDLHDPIDPGGEQRVRRPCVPDLPPASVTM